MSKLKLSACLLVIRPSPQLKLNTDNLSEEETRPPTPEEPGLPLDAPSKNKAAEEEFLQSDVKSSKVPQKCQGIEMTGLPITLLLKPIALGPNHLENVASRGEEEGTLQIDSAINCLA